MPKLVLSLSGPFAAQIDGVILSGLSRRAQALLAFLACQKAMRAERALLADLLWSDRGTEQARASLRQELSMLRRDLPEGILLADRQFVWLAANQVEVVRGGEAFLKGFDLTSEGFEDWLREQRMLAAEPSADEVAAKPGRRASVAGLAFEDLSGAEDFFSDGVVEEITGALSRVDDFDVIARQSSFALREQVLTVPEAAARLGADYLVEGTVRRGGDRVRIAVQLVRGEDGHAIWSERFDDRLDDLFDLQDRIAAQVAGQIAPSLRAAEIARATTMAPDDRTAYELVLTALPHFWAHRREENARAIELLDHAIMRAPNFGPALAYRAWALAQQPVYMWSADPVADRELACEAAERAAVSAGNHAPSLVAVGAAQALVGDNTAALDRLNRALAIDPNNAWGWMRLGWSCIYDKRFDDAGVAFDRAEALSPLDPFHFNVLLGRSVCQRIAGDFDRSIALIREGMRRNPGITWAYRMLVGDLTIAGREAELSEALATFRQHYPHATLRYLRACWPPGIRRHQPSYYKAFERAGVPED